MIISYNWLKEYIKTDITIDQISPILTNIGLEVERIEKIESVQGGLQGVVVGEVLTCVQHPNADRLSLTTVDVGAESPLQIVCGAPNVRAGQKVFVATVGTTLYPKGEEAGFAIKKGKIRGEESLGMICAEDELGIGEGHDGIMVLPVESKVGVAAYDILTLKDDYQIEIGLTPNRADAASHYGVARDLAAYLKANEMKYALTLPCVEAFKVDNTKRSVAVEVEDSAGAPRYAGLTMSGVEVAPSPDWLQEYLRNIGIKPKNNVVDITNFVLHEIGQPLHAFDADKIEGDKIVVKNCEKGTKFTTLDEVEHLLSEDDLMICSATKPMCIAGVFGGIDSGVEDGTTNIFIESAYFNPRRVRQTARRHGLNTDSSFRFERGIDPQATIYALKRAALLIKEYAGGEVSSEIIDVYPTKIEPFKFDFSLEYMNRLIGVKIEKQRVLKILESLDIEVVKDDGDVVSVVVPAYRVDVQRDADLVEEILRIYGYNNIAIPSQVRSTVTYSQKPDKEKITNIIADMLSSNGYLEIMSNSLTKASYYDELSSYPSADCVKIVNPLSSDLNVMRQTLLFNMLEAVELNINHKNPDLKLFEMGNTYHFDSAKSGDNELAAYSERYRLGVLVTGNHAQASWNVTQQKTDFFHLRAQVEHILLRFGIDLSGLKSETLKSDLFGDAISVELNGKELLQMGVVDKKQAKRMGIKQSVYFAEIDLRLLLKAAAKRVVKVVELPKYPEVRRDLALLVDSGVGFSELRDVAFTTERKFLKSVSLFDVYEGDKLPDGKKSYALNFVLEDREKTMNDAMIERIMSNLISGFEKKLGAAIRS